MGWLCREIMELKHTPRGKPRICPPSPASVSLLNFQEGSPCHSSPLLPSPLPTRIYISPIYGETGYEKVCPDPLFSLWNLIMWSDNTTNPKFLRISASQQGCLSEPIFSLLLQAGHLCNGSIQQGHNTTSQMRSSNVLKHVQLFAGSILITSQLQ